MPLGLSDNLFKRVVSALSLLPIVLGLIYLGGWFFFALLVLGGVLMLWEWHALLDIEFKGAKAITTIITTLIPAAILTAVPLPGTGVTVLILVSLMGIVAFPPQKIAESEPLKRARVGSSVGFAYVGMALASLAWLRAQDEHGLIVIWLFFAVWAMDVGGYFAGKGIGGPKLAPLISPKKTWAGLIGGMVLAAIVSLVISLWFSLGDSLLMPFGAALLAAIAQVGDLYESAIKRALDKKDSGNLIPGHGGILDRVDGIIFAAPAVAIAMTIPELSNVSG